MIWRHWKSRSACCWKGQMYFCKIAPHSKVAFHLLDVITHFHVWSGRFLHIYASPLSPSYHQIKKGCSLWHLSSCYELPLITSGLLTSLLCRLHTLASCTHLLGWFHHVRAAWWHSTALKLQGSDHMAFKAHRKVSTTCHQRAEHPLHHTLCFSKRPSTVSLFLDFVSPFAANWFFSAASLTYQVAQPMLWSRLLAVTTD